MLLISAEELRDLTGYRQHGKQIAWLRSYGIPYKVDRWGRPRVLRAEIENSMRSGEASNDQPCFDHIKKAS